MGFKKTVKQRVNRLTKQGRDLLERGLDRHVRLAVSGLSGAGKTTFITGLLEQLLHGEARQLPFWQALREQRIRGVKLSAQPDLTIPRFAYERALASLAAAPPQWPASTRSLSEIRSVIRVQPKAGWRARLVDHYDVTLDLFDYPGEWLLDLPLLRETYASWSQQQQDLLQQPLRAKLAQPCLAAFEALADEVVSTGSEPEDAQLAEVAAAYQGFLQQCREAHLSLLQPGRALLPGDLADAPVLDIFPWPKSMTDDTLQNPLYKKLEQRFEAYKKTVVMPFFENHFRHFNRQVLLVDVLGAIRGGQAAVVDLQLTLTQLLPSFQYGENSLLRRIFGARVEKVLLVATKADALAPSQHEQLTRLLEQLAQPVIASLRYEGVAVKTLSLAAMAVTQAGTNARSEPVLQGWELDEQGQPQRITVRPESLPDTLQQVPPTAYEWFEFLPVSRGEPDNSAEPALRGAAWPHIRMDRALEFLLGDKLGDSRKDPTTIAERGGQR